MGCHFGWVNDLFFFVNSNQDYMGITIKMSIVNFKKLILEWFYGLLYKIMLGKLKKIKSCCKYMENCIYILKISVLYKQAHTSKSTIKYICMPPSNRGVRCCHTNISDCSFNGAFIVYIILISYGTLLAYMGRKIVYIILWDFVGA